MKKLFLLCVMGLATSGLFAQTTDPLVLKNEGSEAFNSKNYPVAYAKYSQYLKQTNNQDSVTAYFCGMAASSLKKYNEAVTYYDIAIQKNYNAGNAYARKALALKALKKQDEYLKTLEDGLAVDPNNKTLVKSFGLHYLKAGIMAQKANDDAKAKECYKKVSTLSNKKMKTDALYSLGILCYNNGANILKKAAPLANSDADKYAAEKALADGEFKEAVGYLEEAVALSPERAEVKTILSQVQAAMK